MAARATKLQRVADASSVHPTSTAAPQKPASTSAVRSWRVPHVNLDASGTLEELMLRGVHELQDCSERGLPVLGGFNKLQTVVVQQEALEVVAKAGGVACAALLGLLVEATRGVAALAGSHWELRVADVTVEPETSSCHTDGRTVRGVGQRGGAGGSAFRIVFFVSPRSL
jgi:hypothetical protein